MTKFAAPILVFGRAAEGMGAGPLVAEVGVAAALLEAVAVDDGPGARVPVVADPAAPRRASHPATPRHTGTTTSARSARRPRGEELTRHPRIVGQEPKFSRMNARASFASFIESVHVLRQMARLEDSVGWTTSEENDSKVSTPW